MKGFTSFGKRLAIVAALFVLSILPVTAGQGTATFFVNVRSQALGIFTRIQGSCGTFKTADPDGNHLSGGRWYLVSSSSVSITSAKELTYRQLSDKTKGEAVIGFGDLDKDGKEDWIKVYGGWNTSGLTQPVKVTAYDLYGNTAEVPTN